MIDLEAIALQRAEEQLTQERWREPQDADVFCEGPGCQRAAVCDGLCNAHYMQRLRGTPLRPLRKRRPGNALMHARARLAARGIHVEETR